MGKARPGNAGERWDGACHPSAHQRDNCRAPCFPPFCWRQKGGAKEALFLTRQSQPASRRASAGGSGSFLSPCSWFARCASPRLWFRPKAFTASPPFDLCPLMSPSASSFVILGLLFRHPWHEVSSSPGLTGGSHHLVCHPSESAQRQLALGRDPMAVAQQRSRHVLALPPRPAGEAGFGCQAAKTGWGRSALLRLIARSNTAQCRFLLVDRFRLRWANGIVLLGAGGTSVPLRIGWWWAELL